MATQGTPPLIEELSGALEKDFLQATYPSMPWRDPFSPSSPGQTGYSEFSLLEIEGHPLEREGFPAKDISVGSCCTAINTESAFCTSHATDYDGIISDQGMKPEEIYPSALLGPVISAQEQNMRDAPSIEHAASMGSADNEALLSSSSILANVLGDALPRIIDDTGCTQTALGKLFEESSMRSTLSVLGVDQSQLLMHLLKNSSEYLMRNGKRRKGKGGRRPAADPRIDPTIDPKKAKRIVANRKSAAKSKEKQRREATSLKVQHDTRLCQLSAMAFEVQLHECIMRNSKLPAEAKVEEMCCGYPDAHPGVLSMKPNNNKNIPDDFYTKCFGQSFQENICGGNDFQTSPTEGSDFGTNCSGSESSYMKLPASFAFQSQFMFNASTSMIALDEHNSQEMAWDFGHESNEIDIENWNTW